MLTSWNRRELLQTAIESILSLNYENIQIIIVDDGSTDSTEDYILNLKIEEIKKEITFIKTEGKRGPGLNKRLGFNKVKGDYIVFMDDDDFYIEKAWLKDSIEIFKKYPSVASIYFNSYKFYMESQQLEFDNSSQKYTGLIKSEEVLEKFMTDLPKPNSTFPAIFDMKKYILAGAKEMKILNDTSIYLRGALAGDVYISDNIIGVYRIHKGSMAKNLSIEYILDNVNEKRNMIKDLPQNIFRKEWLYNQSVITLYHYVEESRIIDWLEILKWSKCFSLKYRFKFFVSLPIKRAKYYKKHWRKKK